MFLSFFMPSLHDLSFVSKNARSLSIFFGGGKGYVKHVFILQPLGVAIGWGIFDDAISSPKNWTNPRPPQLFNFTVTSFLSYGHPTFQLYSYPKTISTDAHVFKRTNHFSKVPIAQVLQVYFLYHFFQIIASGPANTFLGYRMLIQRILPTCFSLIFYFYVFFHYLALKGFQRNIAKQIEFDIGFETRFSWFSLLHPLQWTAGFLTKVVFFAFANLWPKGKSWTKQL